METLKSRLRDVVARQGRRVAQISGVDAELRGEIAALRERVELLEREVQENRVLNQRLAELTDVVAEVLVPAVDRDEEKLTTLLTNYNRNSF